jgi:hypothetical protein
MPWTPRQVRYLESSGSPLTAAQKAKMNAELHADPSLGHKTKGSSAMKKSGNIREMRIEIHRGPKQEVTGHTVHHHMMPMKASKSGAFMEETHHSFPFDADGQSSTHGDMMDHIASHLKLDDGVEGEHGTAGHGEPDGDEAA